MKIHLTYADSFYRAGYENIDRFPRDHHQTPGDVTNLDWMVDNGEASEIIAYQVIDHYRFEFIRGFVEHWVSKLAVGGTLTIVATDLYQIVTAIYNRSIDLATANQLIYGAGKSSTSTLLDISAMMRAVGLEIIESRYEDTSYVVKGKKS